MVMLIALGSALLFGLASVLQHRSARAEVASSRRAGFILRLLASPVWLAGIGADLGGYGLQFLALERGSLVVVQPLLVSGLLFALPFSALLRHTRVRAREWRGALAVVAGLAIFLSSANPAAGSANASATAWVLIMVCSLGPAVMMLLGARWSTGQRRSTLLATATGVLFGLSAALTKVTAEALAVSIPHAFVTWQLYVLVVVGGAGLYLVQRAFASGPIGSSLPLISAVDPVTSVIVGALGFGEGIVVRGVAPWIEALGLGLIVLGVFGLAPAPLQATGHDADIDDADIDDADGMGPRPAPTPGDEGGAGPRP